VTPDPEQQDNVRILSDYAEAKIAAGPPDRTLPKINVIQQMRDVTEASIRAITNHNGSSPTVFISGSRIARVGSEVDGQGVKYTIIKHYTSPGLRGDMARIATWVRSGKDSDADVPPPIEVVNDVLANADQFELPVLRQVVHCPIFARDGTVHVTPGYSPATECWYEPRGGLSTPQVPPNPTDAQVKHAAWKLMGDYLCDFLFETPADRAHALAMLLLPFMRQLVDGPTPLHLVEAPTEGTGKGKLVQACMLLSVGGDVPSMTECRDESEWSKQITGKLMTGQPVIFIDNVYRLASAKLASVLTQPIWEDRILGGNQMLVVPVQNIFVAAGNNVSMSGEIVRRTVRIRINSHAEQPWLREGFKHDPLVEWGMAHRQELVEAALTLVQAWVARGRPIWQGTLLGSFESWSRVVGGVLRVANQETSFLGNLDQLYSATLRDVDDDRPFVAAWWEFYGPQPVAAKDLVKLAHEHLQLQKSAGAATQFIPPSSKSVGRHLAKLAGRVFGDLEVVRTHAANRGDIYQLAQVVRHPR
jgi:putative DNA primase/helicase